MTYAHIKRWVIHFLIGYTVVGTVYYASTTVINLIIGKQNVFSPSIGLPLTILGWPQMVFADLWHIQSLGLKFPTIITILMLIAYLTIIIIKEINQSTAPQR